ncbi:hypothetical protein HMN09_00477400 [Mycena chlorophos]|uniref:Uncharacterized protein n=1 Tax=Mycena chlorophos TaxID=658473 RepID=A0A8H6TKL6_MYCCL|nr:hypothetical protein HMN09_00477400 [Mycena chlorophos]
MSLQSSTITTRHPFRNLTHFHSDEKSLITAFEVFEFAPNLVELVWARQSAAYPVATAMQPFTLPRLRRLVLGTPMPLTKLRAPQLQQLTTTLAPNSTDLIIDFIHRSSCHSSLVELAIGDCTIAERTIELLSSVPALQTLVMYGKHKPGLVLSQIFDAMAVPHDGTAPTLLPQLASFALYRGLHFPLATTGTPGTVQGLQHYAYALQLQASRLAFTNMVHSRAADSYSLPLKSVRVATGEEELLGRNRVAISRTLEELQAQGLDAKIVGWEDRQKEVKTLEGPSWM